MKKTTLSALGALAGTAVAMSAGVAHAAPQPKAPQTKPDTPAPAPAGETKEAPLGKINVQVPVGASKNDPVAFAPGAGPQKGAPWLQLGSATPPQAPPAGPAPQPTPPLPLPTPQPEPGGDQTPQPKPNPGKDKPGDNGGGQNKPGPDFPPPVVGNAQQTGSTALGNAQGVISRAPAAGPAAGGLLGGLPVGGPAAAGQGGAAAGGGKAAGGALGGLLGGLGK